MLFMEQVANVVGPPAGMIAHVIKKDIGALQADTVSIWMGINNVFQIIG